MVKIITLLILILPFLSWSQHSNFNQAYQDCKHIPAGLLETVSWTRTRIQEIDVSYAKSCTGMPLPFGIMGVFDEGNGFFKENARLIAHVSNISIEEQKSSVFKQIKAYALAFEYVYNQGDGLSQEQRIYTALMQLSEIPDSGVVNAFARESQVYEVMRFLNDSDFMEGFGLPTLNLDLKSVFDTSNLDLFEAKKIIVSEQGVQTITGLKYHPSEMQQNLKSIDYAPALEDLTTCNYSSRNGTAVSAVTIHTIQGYYASCISYFHNCNANVSAHYVVRSSDGQMTQVVKETDKAWHVGSENPYTIGIEHEGFVEQTGWYTTAVYNSTANLMKDICNDYNLSRLRTGFFPWMPSTYYNQTGIPGSCIQIKGHQHFPNQTHVDPGVNWDWDYFYKLINDTTTVISYAAASGNLFDSGGTTGNYSNDERKIWTIAPTNATTVSLNFTEFNLEDTWDYLYIYDGADVWAPLLGIYTGANSPGIISSSGGAITVEFRSDCATTQTGFSISWVSDAISNDVIAPNTQITINNNWQTHDFQVNFTDYDNAGGSGLAKSFYQVLYFNGENWIANTTNGFFTDDFNQSAIAPNWTSQTGTWNLTVDSTLVQTNETNTNTNIYAPLTQNLSNRYLYTWRGNIKGNASNRRAGLHIFCDDPTQTNRGNSYFVYFRADDDKIQLYKVINNVFSLQQEVSYALTDSTWYDYAISYDRIAGDFAVYVNNQLQLSWIDAAPIQDGTAVSFRSGECVYEVDNFKVYRSRNPNVTVTVGNASINDVQFQNVNSNTPAVKIKSIVVDSARNLSQIASSYTNVDWTSPYFVAVNDGTQSDIDTAQQITLHFNWEIQDTNSNIAEYQVAIGTNAGATDVFPWTSTGQWNAISHTLDNPIYNQVYYISVRAENGAGLVDTVSSDGQILLADLGVKAQNFDQLVVFPNPANNEIELKGMQTNLELKIYDVKGSLVIEQQLTPSTNKVQISNLAKGVYQIILRSKEQFMLQQLIKQ